MSESGQEEVDGDGGARNLVPLPPSSGYAVGRSLQTSAEGNSKGQDKEGRKSGPVIRPNRMKTSEYVPSEEELAAIKHKKKVIIRTGWSYSYCFVYIIHVQIIWFPQCLLIFLSVL